MDTVAADLEVLVEDGRTALVQVSDVDDMGAAREWLTAHRPALRAAMVDHGAVLVRGLPVTATEEFAQARDLLIDQRVAYREKATPRSDFGDGVFSSTNLPPAQAIEQHNENSYTLEFPGMLLFGCLVAPETGGATPVADSRAVLAGLPADLVERFRTTGWLLRRSFHAHVSLPWTTAFGTEDRAEVEGYCARNLIALRWEAGDGLLTSQRRPATIHHPGTGAEVWFNHVAFWNEFSLDAEVREVLLSSYGDVGMPFQTRYGDGSVIAEEEIAVINDVYRTARRREAWQRGDLLLVDNILASHGREPYRGDRRIVVAMGEPTRLVDCAPTVEPEPGPLD
ncbi:TauD/TfdA family dioxygenase [Actinophytocola sp.]|uniref:TauD/TfdA family dioxygenase n=1 Tax=Actinophytocola sp. TaxID=1872138 RepID=UPI00389B19A7